MEKIYSEIEIDLNRKKNVVYIDVWETKNPNEEGKTIAKIYLDKNHIEYLNEETKTNTLVKEKIIQAIAYYASKKNMDWTIHYVFDANDKPYAVDIHTHGMEKYNHPNFQIVLPIQKEIAAAILNTICLTVKYGFKYDEGVYDGLMQNRFDIKMIKVNENLLRCIIPDEHNLFYDSPKCDKIYKHQISDLAENNFLIN